jgi:hypothetical protein
MDKETACDPIPNNGNRRKCLGEHKGKEKNMTEQKEEVRIYEKMREELDKRHIINAQIYDTSILTFSMGALALLSSQLKGVHLSCCSLVMLVATSVLFLIAVFSTLFSFIIAQKAIPIQLSIIKRYYLDEDPKAGKEINPFAQWLDYFAYLSGITFMAGLIMALILLFATFCKN